MRILIIGGSQFVGRHTVERLLGHGHEVVLVNRGRTGPGLFKSARQIVCDRRSEEFFALLGKESGFEAVIDFCAYHPKDIERLASVLPDLARHYIQISSVSAYQAAHRGSIPSIREEDPLLDCTEDQGVDETPSTYGNRKAGCERAAWQKRTGDMAVTIFRPSVIYGKYDPTDRFAYWVWRVSRGEPFLLPEDGLGITQRTYAPDFSAKIVTAIGQQRAFNKTYNVAESQPLSLRATLAVIGKCLGIDPFQCAVSVSAERLLKLGVRPWSDLPLWIPQTHLLVDTFAVRRDLGPMDTPAEAAITGTCKAFLEQGSPPKAGLSIEHEQELLRGI